MVSFLLSKKKHTTTMITEQQKLIWMSGHFLYSIEICWRQIDSDSESDSRRNETKTSYILQSNCANNITLWICRITSHTVLAHDTSLRVKKTHLDCVLLHNLLLPAMWFYSVRSDFTHEFESEMSVNLKLAIKSDNFESLFFCK